MNKLIKVVVAGFVFVSFTCGLSAGVKINSQAPAFSLSDLNGKSVSLADFQGKYVVLEWINFGCPFVKKHYDSGNMQELQKRYTPQGVVWLSICSSAAGKQGYMGPDEWKSQLIERNASPTAVLLDPNGKVGKLYGAKTTPHMFVIDPKGRLLYQGAIDSVASASLEDVKVATNYVRQALEESLAGKSVSVPMTEAYGCSVKYK